MTVLFADLKGSIEPLAACDPEEARAVLDPVLDAMIQAVRRYGGTVNQVMGDGVMALFGAPIAVEDHAVRACYAALAMQDAVRALRRRGTAAAAIRVGLNSGEVLVRAIGSDLHLDYTAVGETTHLAARMEQTATARHDSVDHADVPARGRIPRRQAAGSLSVKGLVEPVETWQLVGAHGARTRLEARGGALTRFVGRDAEITHAARALDTAAGGGGQIIAIIGELGVGKSRVCHELVRRATARGQRVIETACVCYASSTPYSPRRSPACSRRCWISTSAPRPRSGGRARGHGRDAGRGERRVPTDRRRPEGRRGRGRARRDLVRINSRTIQLHAEHGLPRRAAPRIRLRRIGGWQKIVTALRQHTATAA